MVSHELPGNKKHHCFGHPCSIQHKEPSLKWIIACSESEVSRQHAGPRRRDFPKPNSHQGKLLLLLESDVSHIPPAAFSIQRNEYTQDVCSANPWETSNTAPLAAKPVTSYNDLKFTIQNFNSSCNKPNIPSMISFRNEKERKTSRSEGHINVIS